MFRNWNAICAVHNPSLRFFAATANDEEVLKLQKGFPELFSSEPMGPHHPVPVSILREKGRGAASEMPPTSVAEYFGLPCMLWSTDLNTGAAPKEVLDALKVRSDGDDDSPGIIGSAKRTPIFIDYCGTRWVVMEYAYDVADDESEEDGYYVSIVPADLIDFNS